MSFSVEYVWSLFALLKPVIRDGDGGDVAVRWRFGVEYVEDRGYLDLKAGHCRYVGIAIHVCFCEAQKS